MGGMKTWMFSAACVALCACLALVGACVGDDPTASGTGDDAGTTTEGGATSDSGNSGNNDAGAEAAAATDGESPSSCTRNAVPGAAVKTAVSFTFSGMDTGSSGMNVWRSLGFDRDGRCTTEASLDVCKPAANGPPSTKEDGDAGIDNAWGHGVLPIMQSIDSQNPEGAGALVTDGSGTGTLLFTIGSGGRLAVPVRGVAVARVGTTAILSAIIPTEAFVTSFSTLAARFDSSLCSGSTIESIKLQLRQASDLPLGGTHDPLIECDAISIGATLSGIVDSASPDVDAGSNPCTP
jgi:hypothetical protein